MHHMAFNHNSSVVNHLTLEVAILIIIIFINHHIMPLILHHGTIPQSLVRHGHILMIHLNHLDIHY